MNLWWELWGEMILRLVLATILGVGIGYYRERAGKAAGLRTHACIALGAALFTVASFAFGGNADPARVAAGVVAGVGFIGAGVIFRGMHGDGVAGLTSAACIWVTAAIGLAAGAGLYSIAAIAALLTVIVLMLPKVRG